MKKENCLVLSCFHRFVREIVIYSGFTPQTGLLTGKMGICLLLYHYSRYFQDKEIEQYVEYLFDESMKGFKLTKSMSFSGGITGIAWGVHYLVSNGFIQADDIDEVLEVFDEKLWNDTFECKVHDLDMMELGWYIQARMTTTKQMDQWTKRAEIWMDKISRIFDDPKSAIFDDHKILPILFCYEYWKSNRILTDQTEMLLSRIQQIFKTKGKDEQGENNHRLLFSYVSKNPLFDSIDIHDCENPAFTDMIVYFAYRLFWNHSQIPLQYETALLNSIANKKLTNDLINIANPQIMGLQNNFTGFTWAMMQWIEQNQIR